MPTIWKANTRWFGGVFLAAALSVAYAAAPAIPGTINYIEGQVKLESRALTAKSAGSVQLEPNQTLTTAHGKAEILLTPGIFLRVGDSSTVRMISTDLTDTRAELLQGEAMVEATELLPGNHIAILDHGAVTTLQKNGVYDFKAAPAQVAVYDGKASVVMNDQQLTLKKGKETLLAGKLKSQGFDRKAPDTLYAWSDLRSEYGAEASMGEARTLVVNGGYWGPGWYWNPWWDMYSFIPGDFLYSPFGFGFYPPGLVGYAPFYGYGGFHRHGYFGHGFYGRGLPLGRVGGFGGGRAFTGGGFHSGGFHSGGFHGGGFHGGGGRR